MKLSMKTTITWQHNQHIGWIEYRLEGLPIRVVFGEVEVHFNSDWADNYSANPRLVATEHESDIRLIVGKCCSYYYEVVPLPNLSGYINTNPGYDPYCKNLWNYFKGGYTTSGSCSLGGTQDIEVVLDLSESLETKNKIHLYIDNVEICSLDVDLVPESAVASNEYVNGWGFAGVQYSPYGYLNGPCMRPYSLEHIPTSIIYTYANRAGFSGVFSGQSGNHSTYTKKLYFTVDDIDFSGLESDFGSKKDAFMTAQQSRNVIPQYSNGPYLPYCGYTYDNGGTPTAVELSHRMNITGSEGQIEFSPNIPSPVSMISLNDGFQVVLATAQIGTAQTGLNTPDYCFFYRNTENDQWICLEDKRFTCYGQLPGLPLRSYHLADYNAYGLQYLAGYLDIGTPNVNGLWGFTGVIPSLIAATTNDYILVKAQDATYYATKKQFITGLRSPLIYDSIYAKPASVPQTNAGIEAASMIVYPNVDYAGGDRRAPLITSLAIDEHSRKALGCGFHTHNGTEEVFCWSPQNVYTVVAQAPREGGDFPYPVSWIKESGEAVIMWIADTKIKYSTSKDFGATWEEVTEITSPVDNLLYCMQCVGNNGIRYIVGSSPTWKIVLLTLDNDMNVKGPFFNKDVDSPRNSYVYVRNDGKVEIGYMEANEWMQYIADDYSNDESWAQFNS